MRRNTAAKQKPYRKNIVSIHNIFFEKPIKLNSQPTKYKKNRNTSLKKKKIIKRKKKAMSGNIIAIHNVLKKKFT